LFATPEGKDKPKKERNHKDPKSTKMEFDMLVKNQILVELMSIKKRSGTHEASLLTSM